MTRAMVMAAGAGTRLHPLTHDVPKPMVPICNRPVIEYTVENLRKHGVREIIFNLHSHPDQVRGHFQDGSAFGVKISYSPEARLMGTAGGVKKAESFLNTGTFLVMSGDGLTRVDITRLLTFHRKSRSLGTMGLKDIDSRFDYGVTIVNTFGRIKKFIEKPYWSDVFSNQVNTGIYVFEPSIFKKMPSNEVYDFGHQLWPKMLKNGDPIFGFPVKAYWCDVGSLSEYRRAQRDMLDQKVGYSLPGRQIRKGVWIEDGARIGAGVKLESPCVVGRDAVIEQGAQIGAHSVVGHRSRVGKNAKLFETTLWNDVRIGPNVRLENAIVSHKTQVRENISTFSGAIIFSRR